MLTRFLLALVLGLATLPLSSAPACHAATASAGHGKAAHHESEKRLPVEHYCVGCVTPESFARVEVAPPAPPERSKSRPARANAAPRSANTPATPPPRPGS